MATSFSYKVIYNVTDIIFTDIFIHDKAFSVQVMSVIIMLDIILDIPKYLARK